MKDTGTITSNLDIVRNFISQHFQEGNAELDKRYCSNDLIVHCPPSWKLIHPTNVDSVDDAINIDTEYCAAFKFNDHKIDEVFTSAQDPQKVVVRWTCEGSHVGSFFGIKATQKSFIVCGMSIYLLNEKRKISEVWQSWDMLGLLDQIGALNIIKE